MRATHTSRASARRRTAVVVICGVTALLAAGPMPSAAADDPAITRTPWQMHIDPTPHGPVSGLPYIPFHGAEVAYADANIPAQNAASWVPAPDPNVIGFDGRVPGFGGNNASRLGAYGCQTAVDYTYFQTIVTVPAGGTVTQFNVTFSVIDDGARITIFNSAYPTGVVVPASYVFLNGGGTSDLASYIVEGANRVVVTQLDDCYSGNNLGNAAVVLNGNVVPVGDPPADPRTASAGTSYTGVEGSPTAITGTFANFTGTPTSAWTSTGDIGNAAGAACSFADATAAATTVTCNDNGTYTLRYTATETDGSAYGEAVLTVSNAAPTVTSLTAAPSGNVLVGSPVTFTGAGSDPSTNDVTSGLTWAFNGGTTFGSGNTVMVTPTACGPVSASAVVKDKDGATSASTASTSAVTAVSGDFQQPLTAGVYNAVKAGQVVPVKVVVGCGTNLAGLTPAIQLFSGDIDATTDPGDATMQVTASVSNADTTGVMRNYGGGYMYNLRVPAQRRRRWAVHGAGPAVGLVRRRLVRRTEGPAVATASPISGLPGGARGVSARQLRAGRGCTTNVRDQRQGKSPLTSVSGDFSWR